MGDQIAIFWIRINFTCKWTIVILQIIVSKSFRKWHSSLLCHQMEAWFSITNRCRDRRPEIYHSIIIPTEINFLTSKNICSNWTRFKCAKMIVVINSIVYLQIWMVGARVRTNMHSHSKYTAPRWTNILRIWHWWWTSTVSKIRKISNSI